MESPVHPKYTTRDRATDWRKYERGLVLRSDVAVCLSPEAVGIWKATPTGRRAAQPKLSDLAIETGWTLLLAFHLPLRQAAGFHRSLVNGRLRDRRSQSK